MNALQFCLNLSVFAKSCDNCFCIQTRLHSPTKLKKIIQDTKEGTPESDVRVRIQPLKDLLDNAIEQLHMVFETQVFIIICRGFWDRMGQVGK